jgi:hypothetical protein
MNRLWPSAMFQFKTAERAELALQAREALATKLEFDTRYYHRRGVLALLEGDVRGAKQWFQQSIRKPPAGWYLPEFGHTDSQRYLRLIELAETKARAP